MNIGIFSGSFNPIHIGHVILGNYITEFTDIDEVWFLVTPQSPFKKDTELLGEQARLEMVQLALEKYGKLKASDFEFSMPRPSYTVDTLDRLQQEYPKHRFTLIIGGDNWVVFEKWFEYERILQNYKLKVYPRLGYRITIPAKQRGKVEALDSPIVEISSTFIREGIKSGKNMRPFLSEAVSEYINEKGLYK